MDLCRILDGTPEPPIVDLHLDTANISGEYDLATPMFEFQKELTDQIVSLHYADILKYCETNDTTELINKSLEICVENCMLVASHPYLLIKHYMPKNFNIRDLPAKLAETSGKFNVLRDLVNVILRNTLLPHARHVGVVMRNDPKTFDLVEALLLGASGYKQVLRYVGNSIKRELNKTTRPNPKDPRSVYLHLLPADGKIMRYETELPGVHFDVLIALDGTVDTKGDFVAWLKGQGRRGSDAPVVLKLVPIYSIEHCLEHYADARGSASYLYKLISSIVCLRDQVGNLLPDLVPIYNQNLTFLSHTFFDHVFRRDTPHAFPKWLLPELPNIPCFSATDVERSLLTEVLYHYTPYYSNNTVEGPPKQHRSYYETKRLKLDYVTKPLKHDYASLSGIHKHHLFSLQLPKDPYIMTHTLLLQLNAGYHDLRVIKEEFDGYMAFNTPERQRKCGRRLEEVKRTLTAVIEDCDHAEQRLVVTQNKIARSVEENALLATSVAQSRARLEAVPGTFADGSAAAVFAAQQLKMWQLKKEISDLTAKHAAKEDEKSYMSSELAACRQSIERSSEQLKSCRDECKTLQTKIGAGMDVAELAADEFRKQRAEKAAELKVALAANESHRANFEQTLKFLRDTAHVKKRKGRGITPSGR